MAKDPEQRDVFPGALELMILHSLGVKPMQFREDVCGNYPRAYCG